MMGGPLLFPKEEKKSPSLRGFGKATVVVVVGGGLFGASWRSRSSFEHPTRRGAPVAVAQEFAGAQATHAGIFQVVSADEQVAVYSAGGEIELREKVEIRLARLSAAESSVDPRHGKVVARVGASNDTLAITARETTSSTEGAAHVVVQTDEHGEVWVATLKGKTRFASGGKIVVLPEGTETRSVRIGAPPEDPEKIPEHVFMEVESPEAAPHAATALVEWRVRPASLVTINGATTAVGGDGRFAATMPLREGRNHVAFEAEDLAGRRRVADTTLVRGPTRPPKLIPEPGELWKQTRAKP